MTALTDTAENETLRWLVADGAAVGPVAPLRVALTTTVGTDSTPGTEVVVGTSGYARKPITFGSVANGQVSNSAVVRFDNMPDIPYNSGNDTGGVRGFEIWDSASTPKRWWWAPLTTPRGYAAGDAAEFPPNELVLAME